MAMNYEPYRQMQMEDGLAFQDFVVDRAYDFGLVIVQYTSTKYQFNAGESRSGIEIKYDKKMKKTGNLCIEVAEKAEPRSGPYVPSGIMRDDHWLFAIGDYDIIYFFASSHLRRMYSRKNRRTGENLYRRYETKTSQGFLLPIKDGKKYAVFILEPKMSRKMDNGFDILVEK